MSAGFFTLSKETVAIEFEACVLQPAPNSPDSPNSPGSRPQEAGLRIGCKFEMNRRAVFQEASQFAIIFPGAAA